MKTIITALLATLLAAHTATPLASEATRAWTKDELRVLIDRIADGDLDARHKVGVAMMEGIHVKKDEDTGLRYLKQAAEKNHAPSLLYLSWWYHGFHDQQDADLAYEYLERAVATGDPEANYRLGQNLMVGSWTAQTNYSFSEREQRILELFTHAAERGHLDAMVEMARLHFAGRGVKADNAIGLDWLNKAARAGSQRAHAMLAQMYDDAGKVARDIPRALEHYAKALELVDTIKDRPEYYNEAARLHVRIAELLELTSPQQAAAAAQHYAAAREDTNAVQQTRALADLRLARLFVDYGNAEQVREGMEHLESRAERGDLTAMCFLTLAAHQARRGIPADAERGKAWENRLIQQLEAQGRMPAACKPELNTPQCQAELNTIMPSICDPVYPAPLQ